MNAANILNSVHFKQKDFGEWLILRVGWQINKDEWTIESGKNSNPDWHEEPVGIAKNGTGVSVGRV